MSDARKTVDAEGAPAAIGPYNHAVAVNGLLFCSGQVPLDPESGEIVGETAAEQATQCLKNLTAVCEAADTSLASAVRMTIYTTQLDKFADINDAYAAYFPEDPPARAAVGVAALPKGAIVEIDAIVSLR